jgi:aarF domain-containing kinase
VYKARLRRDGSLVAVKVQRPGIVEQISLDFHLVRGACQFVDKYVDAITTPLVPLLDEFAGRVYQELNYVQVSHALRADLASLSPLPGSPLCVRSCA